MNSKLQKWKATTQQELVLEVWEHLDCESVGARELEQIQQALNERFGGGGVLSPAAVARTVADEGAVLRHPEVFEFDRLWRERALTNVLVELDFETLDAAADTIHRLEAARRRFQDEGDASGIRRTHELALRSKQDLETLRRSPLIDGQTQLQAQEIVQWLTVWLQEPELFDDWLSLRRRSPEFLKLIRRLG